MALNTNLYSGKEFEVYVACDNRSTGCGSFNTTAGEFQRLDVESAAPPTFAPVQEFEMRTGAGRVAQFQQIYSSTRRVVTEFSLFFMFCLNCQTGNTLRICYGCNHLLEIETLNHLLWFRSKHGHLLWFRSESKP